MNRPLVFITLFYVLGIVLGAFIFQTWVLPPQGNVFAYLDKGPIYLIGTVDDAPRSGGFPLKAQKVICGKNAAAANGVVYVSMPNFSLQYGQRLKLFGKLYKFQDHANPLLPEEKIACGFSVMYFEKLAGGAGNPLKAAAIWFNQKFNQVLGNILPEKEASLLGSILLGTTVSPLPDELKDNYRKAGLIHLLVVSGTQVSILIGICLTISRGLKLSTLPGVVITSLFNLMLVVVTGGGPSILRSAIMGEITLMGLLFEREKDFYTALSLSALVLLLINPFDLFNIGFQLSFAATWALVYIAPVLEKKMPSLLAISFAPILATSPIIAYYFSQVSLGAIISNLLVLPWVEFLVILGFGATVLGFINLFAAQVLGNSLWLMLLVLEKIADIVASLPGMCFYIPAPSLIVVAGYYLFLIAFIEALKKDSRLLFTKKRVFFALLLIFAVLVLDRGLSADPFSGKELSVTFLDVGQGDSILVETPSNKKVLIDAGDPRAGQKIVVPFLRRKGINRLDLLVLTHPHDDHVGGLPTVLQNFSVDRVLDSGDSQPGTVLDFKDGVKAQVLGPFKPLAENLNNNSLVMRFVYNNISFIFSGDMEKEQEEFLLRRGFDLGGTVLKVGHHGSSTSSSMEYLKAVHPQCAVISCGEHNKFGHPHAATLNKLRQIGAEIYRTDLNGAIVVKTDGQKFSISPQK